jgi:asparagine synthetase A|tara:strand:- start:1085 stop:1198 length:114 start_codon:yes stop_codon:yes gene_type:complete
MDKIDYNPIIDEGNEDLALLKELVEKINEIIDWINAQ